MRQLCTPLESVYCNAVAAAEVELNATPCNENSKSPDNKLPLEPSAVLHSISAEVLHEIVHTLNFLRYLVEQDGNAALAHEALGFARNEIARLERLVGNLRQLKLPPAHLSDIEVAICIAEIVAIGKTTASARGVQITIEADANLTARGERFMLTSALQNLLLNALESAPCGSIVRIQANQLSRTAQIEFSYEGPSIPQERRALLFDVWTLRSMDMQALRRLVVFRLLRHIGWTVAYDYVEPRNIFRVSTLPT